MCSRQMGTVASKLYSINKSFSLQRLDDINMQDGERILRQHKPMGALKVSNKYPNCEFNLPQLS